MPEGYTRLLLVFLKTSAFRLHQYVLTWWIEERFRNDAGHCRQMLKCISEARGVSDAAYMFWVMDPSYRILESNRHLAWEYLPRPLRELWLLGLVKFQFQSGKGVKNDETFLCFNFDKDGYLAGLKSGIPESEMEQVFNWIKPPENVLSTFREWNSSFYGAKVRTVRLLKIDDLKILTELSRFTQFTDCTEEYIPGYGFVLNPAKEHAAFEILESFGYSPFVDRSAKIRDKAPTDEWRKDFNIAWPEAGSPDYELKNEVDEATLQSALKSTKYSDVYQKLDTSDLVYVLRYAKTTGVYLAAKVRDPAKRAEKEREIMFSVHALHLAKAPLNVDIQEKDCEGVAPLQLSFIQEIKVLRKEA